MIRRGARLGSNLHAPGLYVPASVSGGGGGASPGYAARVASYSPSGFWSFETDFTDSTDNNLDVAAVSTPAIVAEAPGLSGAAHSVQTSSAGADWLIGTDNDLWSPTAFTVGGWCRNTTGGGYIIAKGFSGAGIEWNFRLLSSDFIRTTIGNTAGAAYLQNTSNEAVGVAGDSEWHFMAGTYDGASTMRIYLDGAEVASTTSGPTGTRAANGTQQPAIGAIAAGTSIWTGTLYGLFLIPTDIGIAGLDDIYAATSV